MHVIAYRVERDHRRLEALLMAALDSFGRRQPESARVAIGAAAAHLACHFRDETEELYRAIDRLVGAPGLAVTVRLRREHEVLRELLAAVEESLGRGELAVAEADARELYAALTQHHREQLLLYPILDLLPKKLDPAA